ncbi:glycosyltransferase family 2 protein [Pseudoalteromonas sp. T1lg75]|uniref:glycosyltransferase family 2 protein n=1 Tax=Pseudoalteromonas sp. T1lg75 TaxID=2077102 RepID=UPI000CF717C8|nr:glycosyltransferase family 2 protein [Pseudoalteromonas sp. T1lg75]
MSKVLIAVVSHGHFDKISELGAAASLALTSFDVVILDNFGETELEAYCDIHHVSYIRTKQSKGFGANNNHIYDFFNKNTGITDDDYVLILNPDVLITPEEVTALVETAQANNDKLVTINLYTDKGFQNFDNSIRNFPSFMDFVKSFLFGVNPSLIDKSAVNKRKAVDWAAGSFLLVRADLYAELGGFDEGYFMYCEDLDLCWRAKHQHGTQLYYYPQFKATHLAQHANRKIFSKHFYWHVNSVLRYLLFKGKPKSRLLRNENRNDV